MTALTFDLPPEVLDNIAERAAALLADRQPAPADDGYLDVPGAAAYLACSTSRIYSLVSARRIPHFKDGSRTIFRRSDLDKWIDQGGATAP